MPIPTATPARCGRSDPAAVTGSSLLWVEQALNGLQYGVSLFLLAAGLTLVFGIMNLVNLAHGSLYMLGAYFAATVQGWTGSFLIALPVAVLGAGLVGLVLERSVLRHFYGRDHLDQVLCTFGVILLANEVVRMVWGSAGRRFDLPAALGGSVRLLPGLDYPVFRLMVIGVGLCVAAGLWALVTRTRLGMLIRAGASDRVMVQALGVDIGVLFSLVFALGAALAGLAGATLGPLLAVQPGMGEGVLILTLVVVVIGGIGSVRGAFLAALLVGLADTFGRVLMPAAFGSMVVYLVMAGILVWRPRGLLPAHG
ncbi:MAG: branched-chain amino acid ABC transporter permease [Gemmatimonadaceae bacterium]|nr:branched-chain amino acid ABC transporter permease [Acetobacteraceae bacterium]